MVQRRCSELCPRFQEAMEVLGKPWNGLLVALLEHGALRFSELSERIPTIGDRMLSARLKELEAAGVLKRRVHPGPPVRVDYVLTEAGQRFRQVYDAIAAWGGALAEERAREEAP